jgi:hypothetical protein
MLIPVVPPNRFIFNGYYYEDAAFIQVALIEAPSPKTQDIALFMVFAPSIPNKFEQMCPKIFITGELSKGLLGINKSALIYIKVDKISDSLDLPEAFLNEHNYPLTEIPEETLIHLLNINKL